MAETKYGKHLINIPFITPKEPVFGMQAAQLPGDPKFVAQAAHLKGFNVTITYGVYKESGPMGFIPGKPHIHDFDEVMLLIGADTNDISKLGGEVEVSLGKEEEKHLISTPTAIAVPKGFPHLPATIKEVQNPFLFMTVSLAPQLTFTKVPSGQGET